MGCDIHITAERKTGCGYEAIKDIEFEEGSAPFDWRSYGLFGFLANVRNYSSAPHLSSCRGWPDDASVEIWECDAHSAGWLAVSELLAVDYGIEFFDERSDETTTLRDFLGKGYFNDLDSLVACGADRVVFFFDC